MDEIKDKVEHSYKKVCKNPKCGKEFYSNARNTRYCSQECSDYMQTVIKKKAKVRATKRKAYDENKEINRALSKAYSLCDTVAELYHIPKKCMCSDFSLPGECNGPLERHHANLNPFDNSPDNIFYLCKSHHKAFHDRVGEVNMVTTYNEAVDASGFDDEEEKYRTEREYTRNKINEALNEGQTAQTIEIEEANRRIKELCERFNITYGGTSEGFGKAISEVFNT